LAFSLGVLYQVERDFSHVNGIVYVFTIRYSINLFSRGIDILCR